MEAGTARGWERWRLTQWWAVGVESGLIDAVMGLRMGFPRQQRERPATGWALFISASGRITDGTRGCVVSVRQLATGQKRKENCSTGPGGARRQLLAVVDDEALFTF
jgi:hypothetical protein